MTLLPFLLLLNCSSVQTILLLHSANCPAVISLFPQSWPADNLPLKVLTHQCHKMSKYMFFFPSSVFFIFRILLWEFMPVFWSTSNPNSILMDTIHINSLHSKAKCILGIIHRHFYKSCMLFSHSPWSFVRPILEYASILWDPTSTTTINFIESYSTLLWKLFLTISLGTTLHLIFTSIYCRTATHYNNSFYPSAIIFGILIPTLLNNHPLSLIKFIEYNNLSIFNLSTTTSNFISIIKNLLMLLYKHTQRNIILFVLT